MAKLQTLARGRTDLGGADRDQKKRSREGAVGINTLAAAATTTFATAAMAVAAEAAAIALFAAATTTARIRKNFHVG